jgi:hypothetical protein
LSHRSVRLTRKEREVLKWLWGAERPRKAARRMTHPGRRAAMRRRRRALDSLDPDDIRSLVQIMIELGL